MDRRDDLTWAALELTRLGELRVEEGTLEPLIRRDLGVGPDHPIFIPAATYPKEERFITVHLMEGYCFVATGLPETTYFALENEPYVSKVMSNVGPHNIRTLSVIHHRDILEMQSKLRELISEDITEGAVVKILEGIYKSLEGSVVRTEGEDVLVRIDLRSLRLIVSLPRVFLKPIET